MILLLERRAGLAEFADAAARRPDVRAMIARIEFGVHPDAEAAGYDRMTTILEITLTGGETVSGRAESARGSPANPMSFDEVADKFRDCAAYASVGRARADAVIGMVGELEALGSVAALTGLLAR